MSIDERVSISRASSQAVELFEQLAARLWSKNGPKGQLLPSDCSDELGRFRIWANNIGGLSRPEQRASLDSRLQDAPKIKARILDTLDDLGDALESVLSINRGERPNQISNQTSQSEDISIRPVSEIDELFDSVRHCVTTLMKLSIAIRRFTPRDRYLKAEFSSLPLPSEWDIAHVGQKLPKVERAPWLKKRLGVAITKRRQFLKYCSSHHDRMQAKTEDPQVSTDKSTIASTLDIEKADLSFTEVVSQTSEATSYETFGEEEDRLCLPRLTDITTSFPFECPLCRGMQGFTTEKAWRVHVFRDLRPYVCTFEHCDLKLFESRHAWFSHELEEHRLQWICRMCNATPFSTELLFTEHMAAHLPTATSNQLHYVAKACRHGARVFQPDCPLCDWDGSVPNVDHGDHAQPVSIVSLQQIRRHIGRHMEQLALFALPKYLTQERESTDESLADESATEDPKVEKSAGGDLRANKKIYKEDKIENDDEVTTILNFATKVDNTAESASTLPENLVGTSPRMTPPPRPQTRRHQLGHELWVTALLDFPGQEPGDLSFRQGDHIRIIGDADAGGDCMLGELDGKQGSVPANYCSAPRPVLTMERERKGIPKEPRALFPTFETSEVERKGVALPRQAGRKGIPPNARWTKVDRRLVNPEALELGNERFEEREDYVIVLRILTKEEIQAYAAKTAEIRGKHDGCKYQRR